MIFAHYPLSFHANAQKAAEAIECVIDQWNVLTVLDFKRDYFARWWDANLTIAKEVAEDMWLDGEALLDCVDFWKYMQKVKNQMAFGQSLWVTWTPGHIIVDNETLEYVKVSGAVPATTFDSYITKILGM